jgi:zinc transport system substrate-binding protein
MKKSIMAAIGVGIVVIVAGVLFAQTQSATTPNQTPDQNQSIEQTEVAISKIKVIASFYPLYEFAKNVGGEKTEVSSFVPIGIEPHDWEPSSGDILELKNSDIFIYNGAGFEPFVEQLIDSGEYDNVVFVESAKGIDLMRPENHDEEHDEMEDEHDFEYDPHIWLDPILVKHQVMMIKNAMIEADPQNTQYYETNANAYNEKLDSLDSKIRKELSNCQKDTFMPFHDAFSYFANRYGLKVFPLSGVAPESEATAAELKKFVDFVKEHQIKVIFSEDLVDPRLAEVLADEADAQVIILSPLEGLTNEDLAAGKTYLSKMEENLENLKVALECQ